MSKKEKYAVGVDLGGTNLKLGIVTDDGQIIEKSALKTNADEGPDSIIRQIIKGINEIFLNNKFKIQGVGIGSPGVVSPEHGTVENPPNLPHWGTVPLGKYIKEEFGLAVHVENDANAAAIGEMIFGAGKDLNSFIMITLGTGVGGGIIHNRQIFRGEFGAAGEIGHMTINFEGPKCNCGSIGCIETYIGINYLKKRVSEELLEHRNSKIWNLINDNLAEVTPKIIQEAAEMDDEYAKFVIERMGLHLGAALASVSNLLDINTIIVGGGVAGFGAPLIDAITKNIKERVLTSIKNRVKVIPALLKNDAGIQGASALVFYKSLSG
jgi:glucokinase